MVEFLRDEAVMAMMEACKNAGSYLREMFEKGVEVRKKGAIDLVTEADLVSERIIMDILQGKTPYHIVSEESQPEGGDFSEYFLVDPLDGTTNFSRRIPFYAVSIALMNGKVPVKSVVYLPEAEEFYVAVKGKGAYLIEKEGKTKRIRVSDTSLLSDSVLATGFPYDVWENPEPVIASLRAMLTGARALRRFGSAAIDLCYVAKGIFDGYFEYSLKPWDTAAGFLIVKEAGGKVTDLKGNDYNPFMSEILATNGKIHEQLRNAIIRSAC